MKELTDGGHFDIWSNGELKRVYALIYTCI